MNQKNIVHPRNNVQLRISIIKAQFKEVKNLGFCKDPVGRNVRNYEILSTHTNELIYDQINQYLYGSVMLIDHIFAHVQYLFP